jgi:CBS domain-containing protein
MQRAMPRTGTVDLSVELAPGEVETPRMRASDRLRVRDLMNGRPLVLDADVPLHTAAMLLHDLQLSGAPVVDVDGELIGVISQRELLDRLLIPALAAQEPRAIRRWWSRSVGDVCAQPARCTTPDASVADAADAMLRHDVGRLVVVDGSRVVGMITQRDLLGAVRGSVGEDRRRQRASV